MRGVGGVGVRQRLRRRAVRAAVVLLPGDHEPGLLQGRDELVERGEPDRVGVGHLRPLGTGQRRPLLEREGEAAARPERAGNPADQRVLVLHGEHRLEQEHDVEGAVRERRDAPDLEAAGEVARALAGEGDGALAEVHAQVVAAELPCEEASGPADAAAQVQHRDPGADAGTRRKRADLAGVHEALLPGELAGWIGRHARALQRAVEGGADVLPHEPNAPRKRSRNASIGQTGACGSGRRPSCQPHPAIRRITFGSRATTEIGTSWLAPSPVTIVAG